MTTPDARILVRGRQTHKAITQFARVTFHGKFGIPCTQDNPTLATCCGTVRTQSSSTKFTRQQGRAASADHLPAIIALIHFITLFAIKAIASITNPNFVIGLEFVTPVTIVTNVGGTFITAHLEATAGIVTVQARHCGFLAAMLFRRHSK